MRVCTTGNGNTRIVSGDAVDLAKSGGRGRDFGIDLVGVYDSFVRQQRGQFVQARLIERWIEDEEQAAFDKVAQRADPLVADDVHDARIGKDFRSLQVFGSLSIAESVRITDRSFARTGDPREAQAGE